MKKALNRAIEIYHALPGTDEKDELTSTLDYD